MIEYLFKDEIQAAQQWLHWGVVICVALVVLYAIFLVCTLFVPSLRETIALINKTFGIILVLVVAGSAFGFGLSLRKEPEVVYAEPVKLPDVDVKFPDLPDVNIDVPDVPVASVVEAVSETVAKVLAPPEPKPYDPFPEEDEEDREKERLRDFPRRVRAAVDKAEQQLIQADQRGSSTMEELIDRFSVIEDQLFEDIYFDFYGVPVGAVGDHPKCRPHRKSYQNIGNLIRYCDQQANRYSNRRIDRLTFIDQRRIHQQRNQFFQEGFTREMKLCIKELRDTWITELKATYPLSPPPTPLN